MSLDDNDEIRSMPWEAVEKHDLQDAYKETPAEKYARNIELDCEKKEIEEEQKKKRGRYHPRSRDEKQNITVIPFDPTNPEAVKKGNYISFPSKVNGKDVMHVGRIIRVEPNRIQIDCEQRPDRIADQPVQGNKNYLSTNPNKYKKQ